MYEPTPSVPLTYSAVTPTRSAIAALTLTPVAMLGRAAGSVTRTSLPGALTPDVRATSWRTRSLPRTPYSVLIRIGQTAPYAMTNRRIGTPKPKKRIASGISATAGIGLRNSMTTDEAATSVRELPRSTPRATPTPTAIASPCT
jgi:hypothetical protein